MLAAWSAGPEWERGFTFTVIYYTFQILYKVYVYALLKKPIFKHFYNSQALRSQMLHKQVPKQGGPQASLTFGATQAHQETAPPGNRAASLEGRQEAWGAGPTLSPCTTATQEALSPDVCSALEQLCWRIVDPGEDVPLASPRSDQSPTHRPTGCIRVITWRAWGWGWISCLWLGPPHQGCPQWGSFTHSLQRVL